MATAAQILANRENSKLSTGPSTPEGKAASSPNAKTHGLSAADPVLSHEDRDQFNALLERYKSDFEPTTTHEEFLVSQMAGARWKLDRAERIENAMFAALESPADPATNEAMMAQAMMDKNIGTGFARLDRYRASLERTYRRCARELRATRKVQNEANSAELAEKKFEKLVQIYLTHQASCLILEIMESANDPKTLTEAVVYFANPDNCLNYLVARRWPNGVICPTCGAKDVGFIASRRMWQCKTRHAKAQFSIKLGTIFEDSPLGLSKWLPAMWMIASDRNGISSWELHRAIGVTQKTAWFLLHRVRLAMQDELTGGSLSGEVEVDETYIGGKARNMHAERRRRVHGDSRNIGAKTVVLGMLERGKTVRATVVPDRSNASIQPNVRGNVEKGSEIFSDEHAAHWRMGEEYTHNIVNHLHKYVDGNVHTNGLENFWSLLKRTISGTYVSVEPFHLFRYVDEQAFRFNNRLPMSDGDRFSFLVRKVVGKRLTYAELTGKVGETTETAEPF